MHASEAANPRSSKRWHIQMCVNIFADEDVSLCWLLHVSPLHVRNCVNMYADEDGAPQVVAALSDESGPLSK